MKKLLPLLSFFLLSFIQAQELLVVDLTTTNQVTITATTNASAATVSGGDSTGFYLENFFSNAGLSAGFPGDASTGNLTHFLNGSDNSPDLYRGDSGNDPGLNVWSYSNDAAVEFTMGTQAFSGSASWTLDAADYAEFITAPSTGNIYFPADSADDIANGATLIGTYSVILPAASISENEALNFNFYPNPVKNLLHLEAKHTIKQISIYNILGKLVHKQNINTLASTINTSALASGSYFLKATLVNGKSGTYQLIKQ